MLALDNEVAVLLDSVLGLETDVPVEMVDRLVALESELALTLE